ncbi:hypothetical protein [Bremerella sp. P1]|uniref:hypothetical protein n=1 Tax=Bremerella sp. P1 TaxID=3026424 RepID=UPI0023678D39|nr:hypothetical protein [Bremerella sp. P1]WDI41053.1 hypothetical protein PSR63_21530 [Bremerella sp. P1]
MRSFIILTELGQKCRCRLFFLEGKVANYANKNGARLTSLPWQRSENRTIFFLQVRDLIGGGVNWATCSQLFAPLGSEGRDKTQCHRDMSPSYRRDRMVVSHNNDVPGNGQRVCKTIKPNFQLIRIWWCCKRANGDEGLLSKQIARLTELKVDQSALAIDSGARSLGLSVSLNCDLLIF